ncbi:LysR family transcriptional regulator [Streptomyces liangshanensis]|uniref:LysR family transcriptional regulator n=1 Tax=Streptomyces liangshanensis TaxID=2717324 RepID=A0A6G9GU91_9ACTN|nr:LysR family transcriptional regulator [Streptomyces liangshanensis]QIQ01507.1 LysR family transcriptional regulator [Streptomyces liangshanensis]
MRLDIRHLDVVLAIAEAGSVRRAAARLHLTQPAVTAQLKRIEKHVGGELFVRLRDGVVLTLAGTVFVREATRIRTDLEELPHVARRALHADAATPVRVGGVPAQHFNLLIRALGVLLPERATTSRTVRRTDTVTALLASGELDVAVLRRFPGTPVTLPPGVAHRVLLTEPIFVGVSLDHHLSGAGRIALNDLADDVWVMPHPDDSGMNDHVADACRRAGFEQRIAHVTDEAHVAFELTAAGDAVCVLYPLGKARESLATLTLAGDPLVRDLVLAWRTDSPVAPAVDALCAHMAEGYLTLVEADDVYAQWWQRGGAELAVPQSISEEFRAGPRNQSRGAVGS